MPSNLPPGVTDAMIDKHFGERPEIDPEEVREWYYSTEACQINLTDFVLDRLHYHLHHIDDPSGATWFPQMLAAFWEEWGNSAEDWYGEFVLDNREDY